MRKIYLSGPITGYPNGNRESFEKAQQYLIALPEIDDVTIPHDIVPWQHGAGTPCPGGYRSEGADHSAACHLRADLLFMLGSCTEVWMMPGWEASVGGDAPLLPPARARAAVAGSAAHRERGVRSPGGNGGLAMVEGEEPVTERSAEILAKMAEVRGKVEAMPSLSGMLREALTPEDVQDYSVEARVDVVLALVRVELMRAMAKFAPFSSTHEGWAVIREEVDELWDEVKANSSARACEEAIQVAAMGVRFLVDLASDERMDTMIDSYQKKG